MQRPIPILALVSLVAILSGCRDIDEPVQAAPAAPTTSSTMTTASTTTTTIDPTVQTLAELAAFGRWIDVVVAGTAHRETTVPDVTRENPTPPHTTPATTAPSGGRVHVTAVIPDDLVWFFECVISHESARSGTYTAVNPSGKYRGAYQADAAFFLAYSPPEWHYLAEPPAWETAPPEVQDTMALNGYRARGASPWMGICT